MKLAQSIVVALTEKVGYTVEAQVAQGYTADARIINYYMSELYKAIVASEKASDVVEASSTVEEVVASIKPQTLKSLNNKALSELKKNLEARAHNKGIVVGTDGIVEFTGMLNVKGDGSAVSEYTTYGAALLRSIIEQSYVETGIALLAERKSVSTALTNFLDNVDGAWAMMDEFNTNFSTGLATGDYKLGLGIREYTITKEDSEEHKQALITTMVSVGLADALSTSVNETAKAIMETTVVVEQAKEEVVMTTEETVTITVAEYDALNSIAVIAEQNKKATDELIAKNTEFANLIAGLEKELTIKDELVAKRDTEIAELTKQLAKQNAAVEKLTVAVQKHKSEVKTKGEAKMSEFKLTVDVLNKVEVRATKEGKVTSSKEIEKKDVGNVVKATVKTVSVGKAVNNKIRTVAPEVIIKTANATHTGIDKVAIVAHKTTNVIAKSTNTVIAKSANAVDAILDTIAPTEHTVNISTLKRLKEEAKEGDVYEIDGYSYQVVNGKHIVL